MECWAGLFWAGVLGRRILPVAGEGKEEEGDGGGGEGRDLRASAGFWAEVCRAEC